ncbi:MAG: toll/interleukin-1 receptor domain-containing protein [Pseudomonadota bacterium]
MIFVSYSRADGDFAESLAHGLQEIGFNIWLDKISIPAGASWDREIERAIEDAEVVIPILSPHSVQSENVLDEISFALERLKTVIPVIYKDCSIPLRIVRKQRIDVRRAPAKAVLTCQEELKSLLSRTPNDQTTPMSKNIRTAYSKASTNPCNDEEGELGNSPVARHGRVKEIRNNLNLGPNNALVLVGRSGFRVVSDKDSIGFFGMLKGGYSHYYVVDTSPRFFAGEFYSPSKEVRVSFRFRVSMVGRVLDVISYLERFGVGASMFSEVYAEIRQNIYTISVRTDPARFFDLQKEMEELCSSFRPARPELDLMELKINIETD